MQLQLQTPRDSCQFKIPGTKTYRRSSVKILSTYGGNRQNVGDRIRSIYQADPGYKFVGPDQAGAEALIVSRLCRPGKYRQLFEHNIKPHTFVALNLFADVWRQHIKASLVDLALRAPIDQLSSIPGWKDLDKLIKSSDKWSGGKRYYYIGKKVVHACLTSDHEVLTKDGWVKIKNKPTNIMVWNKGNLYFDDVVCWNEYDYEGKTVIFKAHNLEQRVTPNHKMLFYANNKERTLPAASFMWYKEGRIPYSGEYNSVEELKLSSDEVKFLVALQADGTIPSKKSVIFHFVKKRKIRRLLTILKALKFKYYYRKYDHTTTITVYDTDKFNALLTKERLWGAWLLKLSNSNLDVLIEELKYWDGSETIGHTTYYSAKKENVKWLKTILHLRNKAGIISNGSRTYKLSINNRKLSRIEESYIKPYKGKVYCPTTNTGFFLIRRKGKISVTGNSSYGMKENTFISSVLAETLGSIVLTKVEAKEYQRIFFTLFPEILFWQCQVREELLANRMLHNLFGFPRIFTGYIGKGDEHVFRDAIAFVPQSTVGCITAIAFTLFQNYIEENRRNWHLVQDTHDSYMALVPDAEVREAGKIMQQYLEQELTDPFGDKFKMRSELSVGSNWGKKTDTNPDGLEELKL